MADLHDGSLRDLLLPGNRAAPGACGRICGKRVPAHQRRAEIRPGVQDSADPVQDERRVPAAERHPRSRTGGRRRVRRAHAVPNRHAARRPAGSALPPHRARAHAPVRVRHHSNVVDPAQHPAVGQRGIVGLHDRHLASDRSDDRTRRRGGGHRPENERARGLHQRRQRSHDLQPRSRGVRVHRVPLGKGRDQAVPVLAAKSGHRWRRGRVHGGASPDA